MATLTEGFNYWIDKLESFSFNIPFFNIKIGFHSKTLKYYRVIVFCGLLAFLIFWIATGYEATIIRLYPNEELQKLPQGVGIHFGTIIFTLASFLIISYVLQKASVIGIRNVMYSFIASSGLINGLFEAIYTILYDLIHHGHLWINLPFLYNELGLFRVYPTYRNWYWVFAGILLIFLLKNNYKGLSWTWQLPRFRKKVLIVITLTTMFWLAWIAYPFDYIQVRAKLFPQYIYGFREYETVPEWIAEENIIHILETDWSAVYVENLGVRIINEITKLFHFIMFTYLLIPRRKRDRF